MPPPTEQGFQPSAAPVHVDAWSRNAPSNRTRISTGGTAPKPPGVQVAMPPPTEQGFQHHQQDTVVRAHPVAMPPPTEQGFQRPPEPDALLYVAVAMPPPTEQGFQHHLFHVSSAPAPRRNAPSNRTRISTETADDPITCSPSQCPLQQNKDFNVVPDVPGPGCQVAMPPPTEQGFQRINGKTPPLWSHVAMPPPTEQGFQRCKYCGTAWKSSRNAPSNRTRISTPIHHWAACRC